MNGIRTRAIHRAVMLRLELELSRKSNHGTG